ncbi:hypothetical protein PQO03_08070 [Lentisphaera profundi]|uniref:Lipoprotein n=1 Tax=Lentisphaera profundi TaxID=1658616 RepID=A0ABY7VNH6_9BACT|nr:hypothetical protein [Lentisphaera profundi]WDE95673.1 hypothetical protein PQO03_08070 [Lentisphaera profundi]
MKKILLIISLISLVSCGFLAPVESDPKWRLTAYEIYDGAYSLECYYKLSATERVEFPATGLRLNKPLETTGEVDGWEYELEATAVVHEGALIVYYEVKMTKGGLVKRGAGAIYPRQ